MNLDLLGDEPSGLAALSGIRPLQEQQLGLMEDVHQHREFSINQWLQTLLESVYDILDSPKHTKFEHIKNSAMDIKTSVETKDLFLVHRNKLKCESLPVHYITHVE